MNSIPRRTKPQSTTFLEDITFKYLPYWPLFVLLAGVFLVAAIGYLRVTKPVYEINATILLNDEKKGAEESQLAESLNIPTSKKIVENELEVIKSRKLMDDVVKTLHLYAPLTEKARVKKLSAYTTSPIVIEHSTEDSIKEFKNIAFSFDSARSLVLIGKDSYPLNMLVNTPYGTLKFLPNPRYVYKNEVGQLSFSLHKVKSITSGILGNLDVSSVGKLSSIVKLKMKDEVPQRGEDILNRLLEYYNKSSVDFKNSLAKNTLDFLDARLALLKGDISKVEKQIQNYKTDKGVVNLTDQGRLYLQNVSQNDQTTSSLNMKMAVLDQVEKYVTSKEAASGIVPATLGVDDPQLSKLLDRLYQTESEYQKVKRTAGENNPMAQNLAAQIESLRPGIMENIQNQKNAVSASLNNVKTTNSGYNTILSTIPQKERELIEVSREQAVKNNAYAFLLQKREQTALAYSSNVADAKVIDQAQASVLPVGPKKKMILLGGIALALVFTVAYILLKELLTTRLLFRREIESMSALPIAGELSFFKGKKPLLNNSGKKAQMQNQVRQLIAATGLLQLKPDYRKILVTSSISGEGKSSVSAQLAINLAMSGKKVILLDMDNRHAGLTDTLANNGHQFTIEEHFERIVPLKDIIVATNYSGLFLIPSKALGQSAGPLLTEKTDLLLKQLETEYDFIISDSVPVTEGTDAYVLSQLSDLTLFVIRHNFTPKRFVKNLDESLLIKPLNNPAIVFNGIKPRGFIIHNKHLGYGIQT